MNESELFKFLKDKYIPDLKGGDEYLSFDCYSEKHKMFIELKCREVHYETLMIEKYKYDRLVDLSLGYGYTPYYINSTPKGVYSFKLALNPEWIWKLLPKTTQFAENHEILKQVGYLDLKNAKQL
jgi:hypothetical protein